MFKNSYYYPFPLEIMKQDLIGHSGVYLIKNEINGNCYIGSAISKTPKHNRLYFRFRNHFFNTHKLTNIHLHRAMQKYGLNKFSYHILAFTDMENVRGLETLYINQISPKYNLQWSVINTSSSLGGYSHTKENREILVNSYPIYINSNKHRKIGKLNKGKILSSETKEKIKQSALVRDKETRAFLIEDNSLIPEKPVNSKKVKIYDGTSGKLLKILPSARQVSRNYPMNYRAVKRYLKSGLVYKKLNIKIKY